MSLQDLIIRIPFVLGFIGCVFFAFNYKRFSELGLVMGWFVVFTTLCEFGGILLQIIKENNLFILHIYTLGAFVFCGLFFQKLFRRLEWNYFDNKYLYTGILLIVLNSLFVQNIDVYNSYSKTSSQLLIICLCVLAYMLLVTKTYNYKDKESVRFFIAAILLTCAVSTSLYLFSHQIMTLEKPMQQGIWMINIATNGIVQILYIIGFVKMAKV